MKIIYTLFIFCFIFLVTNIAHSTNKPDIVWEKQYQFPEISLNPWLFMNYSEDGILLWLEGVSSVHKNNPFTVMLTDKKGNQINRKDYARPDGIDAFIDQAKIFKKNNLYEIIGTYSFGYSRPIKKFLIDNECNVTGDMTDTVNIEHFNDIVMQNYLYDSIYVGTLDGKWLTDSNNVQFYQSFQSYFVYDSDIKFVRKLILDTNGINAPLKMQLPQVNIFPNDEKNIIAMLSGPINNNGYFYGKVDYIFLCKYNLSGQLIWKCKLDITETGFERIQILKVHQLPDGSYNFIGKLQRGKPIESAAIMGNVSESGELNWSKTINYSSLKIFTANEPKVIGNGNYFVLYSDLPVTGLDSLKQFWLMIVDKDGNKLDEYLWNTETEVNSIIDINETESGNLIILGKDNWHSLYLAEIKPKFISDVQIEASPLDWFNVNISPNPAKENLRIELNKQSNYYESECEIINLNGETMAEFVMQSEYILYLGKFTSGSYYLKINIKDNRNITIGSLTKRFMVTK